MSPRSAGLRLRSAAAGLLGALLLAALLWAPLPARADCPPIRVILAGRVVEKGLDLPLTNLPITVRMEARREGLTTATWEAVVTDADGRFRWAKDFPADPCHEGVLGKLGGAVWGWTAKMRSRAYHRGARALPERILLNTGPRVVPIEREELLDELDDETHTVEIDVDVTL